MVRTSRQRSRPIVASSLLSGLVFYRAVSNEMTRCSTVEAKTKGPPQFALLPGKPCSPHLHGLRIGCWAHAGGTGLKTAASFSRLLHSLHSSKA